MKLIISSPHYKGDTKGGGSARFASLMTRIQWIMLGGGGLGGGHATSAQGGPNMKSIFGFQGRARGPGC